MSEQTDPRSWFNSNQWAAVEKLRATDATEIHALRRRLEALESHLVYARNFLPEPLKSQAEALLWPPP